MNDPTSPDDLYEMRLASFSTVGDYGAHSSDSLARAGFSRVFANAIMCDTCLQTINNPHIYNTIEEMHPVCNIGDNDEIDDSMPENNSVGSIPDEQSANQINIVDINPENRRRPSTQQQNVIGDVADERELGNTDDITMNQDLGRRMLPTTSQQTEGRITPHRPIRTRRGLATRRFMETFQENENTSVDVNRPLSTTPTNRNTVDLSVTNETIRTNALVLAMPPPDDVLLRQLLSRNDDNDNDSAINFPNISSVANDAGNNNRNNASTSSTSNQSTQSTPRRSVRIATRRSLSARVTSINTERSAIQGEAAPASTETPSIQTETTAGNTETLSFSARVARLNAEFRARINRTAAERPNTPSLTAHEELDFDDESSTDSGALNRSRNTRMSLGYSLLSDENEIDHSPHYSLSSFIDVEVDNELVDSLSANFSQIGSMKDNQLSMLPHKPRHSHMGDITNRLRTFYKRSKFSPSNISLAYAGFFYDRTLDITTCYSCGRSFKNWPADSNPWIEHAYYTPMCTHIRMYAGINFSVVVAMLRKKQTSIAEEHIRRTFEEAGLPYFNPTDQVATTYPNTSLFAAFELFNCPNVVHLLSKNRVTVGDVLSSLNRLIENKVPVTEDILVKDLIAKDRLLDRERMEPIDLIGAQSKDDLMVEQNSMLKAKLMCIVCYTNERDILLLPCCHLVTCYKCTSQITLCPICRKQFTNLTKVFR